MHDYNFNVGLFKASKIYESMIKILKKLSGANKISVSVTVNEDASPGTWGNLQLLNDYYRSLDDGWMSTDRYKQLEFNTAFLEETLKEFGELHCEYCGKPHLKIYKPKEKQGRDVATTDHVLPQFTHPHLAMDKTNLRVCCQKCNTKKGHEVWDKSRLKFPYIRFFKQENWVDPMGNDNMLGIPLESDMYFCQNKELFISKYRVMFGYRLHAGWIDTMNQYFELDICCGPDELPYLAMFASIKKIIAKNGYEDPFKGLPTCSRIKPYYKDTEFCELIKNLAEG